MIWVNNLDNFISVRVCVPSPQNLYVDIVIPKVMALGVGDFGR